ncbi:MAG TPA: MFS transporter [Solirubrobacteraceae bacterium]|nr:MFS transporter [Solirubrobacteraceae bacterium]
MRRLVAFACLVVFVDTMFYAAITPILPQLSDEFDLSKTGAGILAAAYPAGTFIGALPGGWMAARVGVKPTVLLGLSMLVVSSLAFAFGDSIVVLDVARFVQGLGGAASWAGALAWLIGAAPRHRRGELIGTALAAAVAGALFGPVLGALADAMGQEAVFGAVAVVGLAMITWAARMPAAQPDVVTPLRTAVSALGDRRVAAGMWLTTLPGLLFGTVAVLAPLRLDELGAGSAAIAAAFLAGAALEAVAAPVIGRLSDRRGRLIPCIIGVSGGGLSMLILPWPESALVLAVIVVLASPAIGVLYTPAMAMLSEGAEEFGIAQGYAFALTNLAWGIGQGVGEAGSGRLADALGDRVPYLILAAVAAATLVVLLRQLARRAPQRALASRA